MFGLGRARFFGKKEKEKAKSLFFDGKHRCICCTVTHNEEGCCQKFMSPEESQLLFAHLPREERAEKMFKWILQKMEE
jgi:hypothetical protein